MRPKSAIFLLSFASIFFVFFPDGCATKALMEMRIRRLFLRDAPTECVIDRSDQQNDDYIRAGDLTTLNDDHPLKWPTAICRLNVRVNVSYITNVPMETQIFVVHARQLVADDVDEWTRRELSLLEDGRQLVAVDLPPLVISFDLSTANVSNVVFSVELFDARFNHLLTFNGTNQIPPINSTIEHSVSTNGDRMQFTVLIRCPPHHFGKTCEYICMPNDHYNCTPTGHQCHEGWTGDSCQEPLCDFGDRGGCQNNGTCVAPNICQCPSGWRGDRCEICTPRGGCKHGTCNAPGECVCQPNWSGPDCDRVMDPCRSRKVMCKNFGICIPGTAAGGDADGALTMCKCRVGFTGPDCSIRRLSCDKQDQRCGAHGVCVPTGPRFNDYLCRCNAGYWGADCSNQNSFGVFFGADHEPMPDLPVVVTASPRPFLPPRQISGNGRAGGNVADGAEEFRKPIEDVAVPMNQPPEVSGVSGNVENRQNEQQHWSLSQLKFLVGACGLFLLLIFMTLLVCTLRFTGFCNSVPINNIGSNRNTFDCRNRRSVNNDNEHYRRSAMSSTCVVLPPLPPPSYSELQIDEEATKVVDYYHRCRVGELAEKSAENDRKENYVYEEAHDDYVTSTTSSYGQENIKVILM